MKIPKIGKQKKVKRIQNV